MAHTYVYEAPLVVVSGVEPSRGLPAGGQAVVVTGKGFAAGATVTFGGVLATGVVVDSATRIRATTPSHADGQVNVVVTNTDTTTATLVDGFEYQSVAPDFEFDYRTPAGFLGTRVRTETQAPQITQQIGQPATYSFTTETEPAGESVTQVRVLGVLLFIGLITHVVARFQGAERMNVWDVTATDYTHELSKLCPTGDFVDVSGTYVIVTLMGGYGTAFGVDIELGLPNVTVKLDGTDDLWTVIVNVCQKCGAKALMDGTTLRVFTEDPGMTPAIGDIVITGDPDTDNPDIIWDETGNAITIEYDYTTIRNRIRVRGAAGVEATLDNATSIRLYGLIHKTINDDALTTQTECVRRAQAELDAISLPIPVISYATRDMATRVCKPVDVDCDRPLILGTFIVESCKIDQLDLSSDGETRPRFVVTARPASAPFVMPNDMTSLVQSVIGLNANANKSPRLSGDVNSDPGGPTTIPPATITNDHLAGCVTTDKLTPGPTKDPVAAATTGASIALHGLPTVGGIALQEGDRVLVKDQTDPAENGIYVASAATGLWARSTDANSSTKMVPGITVVDASSGTVYYLSATAPVLLGTTALAFLPITGSSGAGMPVVLFLDEGAGSDDAPLIPGPMGPQGIAGATGAAGAIGIAGPPGFAEDGEDGMFVVGPPGPAGADGADGSTVEGGGAALRFTSEISAGTINGVNRIFTTAHAYQYLEVFVNGLLQLAGWDYVELTSTTFELTYAPVAASGVTPADVVATNYDAIVGGTTDPATDPTGPTTPTAGGDPITASRVFPPTLDVSRPIYFGVVGTGFDGATTSTTIQVVGQTVREYVPQGQGGSKRAFPPSVDTIALAAGTYSVSVSTNRAPNTVVLPNALLIESWVGSTIKYLMANLPFEANDDSVDGIRLSKSRGSGPSRGEYVLNIWGSGFSNKLYLSANAAVTLGDVDVHLSHLGYNGSGALGSATYDGTFGYIAIDLAGAALGSKDLIISSPIFAAGSVTFVGAITVVP